MAEAAIIVAVVGWFVSPNIAILMETARACASNKYRLSTGIKEKLQNLARDLEDIKALLDPASTGFVNDPTWLDFLWRLKDGIHDAEEILDLFQLEILEAEAGNDPNRKLTGRGSLSQLEKVLDNLRERAHKLKQDPQRLHGVSPISTRAATAPCPVRDKERFFGYSKEYAQLISMLRWDGNKDKKSTVQPGVIAIIGHGGMGKTELARQVYRDAKGKFHPRIWVHAYGKLTEFDLLREIWRSAAGDRPVSDMNLSSLQRELKKLLKSRRCLLMLDDVWHHERATSEDERKHVRVALDLFLSFVGGGSRVVITTRAKICSTTLGADASIVLNGIEHKQVTHLLSSHAAKLAGDSRTLELLNSQVPKLKGSPLAAIEIGDELIKEPREQRCNVLRDMERHMGNVFSGHLFTYHHLPPHLQRCLAFCSIFPFGWKFDPGKLARMWIAHGFIDKDALGGNSMEDIARGYFDSLVDRSLFKEKTTADGHKQTYYMIHEHIHWMLRRASAKHCISITRASAPTSIPVTARHLSVTSTCLDHLRSYPSGTLNNLRTLLILQDNDDHESSTPLVISAIDKDILEKFKGVRVLDLTETTITELPASIGKLKHVRYLGLPSTVINLCHHVTGLLFLQTLSVVGGDKRGNKHLGLPEGMNKLINMRHLHMDMECIATISGIGRLVKLQGSIEFQVIERSKKEGHSISELSGMNSLGGTLSIKGLEAVVSEEEAEEARLASKGFVNVLKLQWEGLDPRQVNVGTSSVDAAAAVLEGLQPHHGLRDLRIARYPGATWPSWLGMLEKLACLYLWNCRKLQALPALGGLTSLELLYIKELTSVERIDCDFCGGGGGSRGAFPKLKEIVLDDMPKLVAWGDMPKQAFPRLREVSISHCPTLSLLSGLECCRGPVHLLVTGCPAITPATLPANFSAGASTCKFH